MTKKTDEIGYYSLIQYCPDEMIGEIANIGVILFAPKTGFVDVRITPTNQRVAHIFGGGIHKYDTLQRYKEGLSEWVKTEHRKFAELETAKKFLASNANSIMFTPLRSTLCPSGAEERLESLFANLFPSETTLQSEKPQKVSRLTQNKAIKALHAKHGRALDDRIAILPGLRVASLEQEIPTVFAFQNGHFNIVFSQTFNEKHYSEQVGFGLLISNELKMAQERYWHKAVPIILGSTSSANQNLFGRIMETYKRHKIQFYCDVHALIDDAGKAKKLPDFAVEYAIAKQKPFLFGQPS
jgi:hypothetical protein